MKIIKTALSGVVIVETKTIADNRGSFSRLFCNNELSEYSDSQQIVQINHSITLKKGTIRGMHFQFPPCAEIKFIRCIKGRVFDVALDLRKDSKTFLQWHGEELTPENNKMFIIPQGCAHGFQSLENNTELLYLHTAHYQPEYERGVHYADPAFNIRWPLACTEISNKDVQYSNIETDFQGIEL